MFLALIALGAIIVGAVLGYGFLGPMLSGFKPFTTPKQAAEYDVYGMNAHKRLRKNS